MGCGGKEKQKKTRSKLAKNIEELQKRNPNQIYEPCHFRVNKTEARLRSMNKYSDIYVQEIISAP